LIDLLRIILPAAISPSIYMSFTPFSCLTMIIWLRPFRSHDPHWLDTVTFTLVAKIGVSRGMRGGVSFFTRGPRGALYGPRDDLT
jgi:hypothetical protein